MKISFIGFGNMAKAMAHRLLKDSAHELYAASPSLENGINAQGIRTYNDNLAVLAEADIIILAVKPLQMEKVITQISACIPPHSLVISVATGISLSWFASKCPHIAMVRAMPNIAAAIGESATPLIANAFVNEKQKEAANTIFKSIGITTWVQQEGDIDAFTALSGSGPAYIFMFMEAMIKAATTLGIKEDAAKIFTLQTVEGALSLAIESKQDLTELRKKVTSPAGTTAAAIGVLSEHGFDKLIYKAMKAAYDRAKELGALVK